jgi:cell division protein FtsB
MVTVPTRRLLLKDIYEVIRTKKAQQAQLGEQIEALQAATRDLEAVQHLLQEDDAPLTVARRAGS